MMKLQLNGIKIKQQFRTLKANEIVISNPFHIYKMYGMNQKQTWMQLLKLIALNGRIVMMTL